MAARRRLSPEFSTTQDLMDAAGVSRRTIWVWIGLGLLDEPVKVSQGNPGGVFNRFPAAAVERARFIAAKRLEGYLHEEIKAMIEAGVDSPPPSPAVRLRGDARPTSPSSKRDAGPGVRVAPGRGDRLHHRSGGDAAAAERDRRGQLGRKRK